MKNVRILDREPYLFERGVKGVIYIHALRPALNKDGDATNSRRPGTVRLHRSPRQLAVLTFPNSR
ncbi:hypothetical protein DPMN_032039 [Dreissena polymorpha]|uniref:Uncharacterized protein n=1 Tax=Dreissena polymorpha TaxID=45954 RepID=A0A9D4M305_DREPO|nr:hypothetical protein DPMN_032039 [Dreissena polymorpha]